MSARAMTMFAVLAVALLLIAAIVVGRLGIRLPGAARPAATAPEPIIWVNKWTNPPPRLRHIAFSSEAMGHEVGVSIMPPAHDQPAPLIIFLHGRGGDETTDLPAFMALLQTIVAAQGLPEPLVVFPNGGLTGYRGAMATMLTQELLPFLERHYRVSPERHHRLLAGFSMGGAGAVRLQLQHPELFGGTASWGGGVWHKDTALFESVLARADMLRELDPHFLLVNGSEDRPDAFVPLVEVFQQAGVTHRRMVLDGVAHEMGSYFERSVDAFTEFLRGRWTKRP